uniref:(northern house mosquito) hypothetical protein n=1 Tax=Culex pipiens TaxID=7175 RepID=A0A8D8A8C8_CULPI
MRCAHWRRRQRKRRPGRSRPSGRAEGTLCLCGVRRRAGRRTPIRWSTRTRSTSTRMMTRRKRMRKKGPRVRVGKLRRTLARRCPFRSRRCRPRCLVVCGAKRRRTSKV